MHRSFIVPPVEESNVVIKTRYKERYGVGGVGVAAGVFVAAARLAQELLARRRLNHIARRSVTAVTRARLSQLLN